MVNGALHPAHSCPACGSHIDRILLARRHLPKPQRLSYRRGTLSSLQSGQSNSDHPG